MCDSPREPASVEAGLAMLDRALDVLNAGDVASLPAAAPEVILVCHFSQTRGEPWPSSS